MFSDYIYWSIFIVPDTSAMSDIMNCYKEIGKYNFVVWIGFDVPESKLITVKSLI